MNTYEITFTRENGSTGKDRITAANEKQARKDFREIHRHSSATITDVIVAAENVPASKQQERDALDQIRAIVDTLGPDSYLATAFAGCFEDAEENIKNDFACSMKQRLESAEAKRIEAELGYNRLVDKLAASEKALEAARSGRPRHLLLRVYRADPEGHHRECRANRQKCHARAPSPPVQHTPRAGAHRVRPRGLQLREARHGVPALQ